MNRGSEWRKWDLHLHSPYTVLNNQYERLSDGSPNVENFINVIKQNNIAAVGLTNYFNFTDDDFCLKKSLEDEGIAVFLNLEVRLSNINNTDQLFDYHIVFDNKLENQIIKDLLVKLTANVGNTNKPFSRLTNEEIKDRANVSFESLLDTLKQESNISERYLKGFLSRGHGNARTKKDSVYENICINSDFVIHSSCDNPSACSDRRCNHNNISVDRKHWLNHSKYIRPLLQSSDAHSLDGIGTRYSWIKADLTFDGLRQILFEPEERIAFGAVSPDKKFDYLVIDSIEYGGKKLYLNSGLNTIIGGRSTGKSTLLKSIAKYQESGNGVEYTLMDEQYDFSIIWRDGIQDPSREVEYISQNYMQEVAEKPILLNEIIKKILRNKNELIKEEQYQHDVAELKSQLSQSVDKYYETVSKYQTLQKPEGDLAGVDNQIKNLESQIQGILRSINFSEQEKVTFDNVEKEIAGITENLKVFENDIQKLEILKSQPFLELNSQFQSLMNQLSNNNKGFIDDKISELLSEAKYRIAQMIDTRISVTRQDIITLRQKLQDYTSQEIYQKGLAIRGSSNLLSQLYEAKQSEINKRNQIESYNQERKQLWAEIKQEMSNLATEFAKYKHLVDNLAKDYELKAGDLTIKLNVRKFKFEDKIDFLDGRDRVNRDFLSKFDEIAFDKSQMNTLLINMFPLHTKSIDFKFKRNKNIGDLIKEIFVNDWFDYDYEIIYQGDNFKQMSQGKKAFVVLQLLLDYSDDKKPILIDQPEDSLDNRAIYNELRKYLVQKKAERQIIVVTHNPNIVVGADSENVIVANQHSSQTPNENNIKFDYYNGALENSKIKDTSINETLYQQGIREHVFEILEGGKEAFEKREQKYNMK